MNTSEKEWMPSRFNCAGHRIGHVQSLEENGERIAIGFERLCRRDASGNRDYRDPQWSPVLWSEASHLGSGSHVFSNLFECSA